MAKMAKAAVFEKKDKAMDRKAGVKEGSKADMKKDAKVSKFAAGGSVGGNTNTLPRAGGAPRVTMPGAPAGGNTNALPRAGGMPKVGPAPKTAFSGGPRPRLGGMPKVGPVPKTAFSGGDTNALPRAYRKGGAVKGKC